MHFELATNEERVLGMVSNTDAGDKVEVELSAGAGVVDKENVATQANAEGDRGAGVAGTSSALKKTKKKNKVVRLVIPGDEDDVSNLKMQVKKLNVEKKQLRGQVQDYIEANRDWSSAVVALEKDNEELVGTVEKLKKQQKQFGTPRYEPESMRKSKLAQEQDLREDKERSQMAIADLESQKYESGFKNELAIKRLEQTVKKEKLASKKAQAELEKQQKHAAEEHKRELERFKQMMDGNVSKEVENLQIALEEKQFEVTSQEELLQSTRKQIDGLQSESYKLEQALRASRAECHKLKADFAKQQSERNKAEREEIDQLNLEVHDLRIQLRDSQIFSRCIEDQLKNQQQEEEEWKSQKEEQFKAELEEKERAHLAAKDALRNELNAKMQDKELQNARLMQANEIVTDLNKKLREDIKDRDEELTKLKAALQSCEDSKTNLEVAFRKDSEEYENELNALKVELMVAREESKRANDLKTKAHGLESEVMQLKTDLRKLGDKLHETKTLLEMWKESAEKKQKESEENRATISALRHRYMPIEDELRRTKNELANYKHLAQQNAKTIRDFEVENGSLKAKLYETQSLENIYEKEAHKLHKENVDLQGRVQTYQYEVKNLEEKEKKAYREELSKISMFLQTGKLTPQKVVPEKTLNVVIPSPRPMHKGTETETLLEETPKKKKKKIIKKRKIKSFLKSPAGTGRWTERRANLTKPPLTVDQMAQITKEIKQETKRQVQTQLEKARAPKPWR